MSTLPSPNLSQIKKGATALASSLLLAVPTSEAIAQSKVAILGVDHVGINVPDLQQAVTFFSEVLGFTPVTQLGPLPLDENWKKTNRMHATTGPVSIKMIRTGSGANIELFEYQDNKGSQEHPGGDDIGASHIAFYTTDIQQATAYLKTKGVNVLGEPFLMPSGDTEGESWLYFDTPWGYKMELVSYPHGKGYEKRAATTKLWSPKDAVATANLQQNAVVLSDSEMRALVETHLRIWNEKDLSQRNRLMNQVYAEAIEMVDRHFVAVGHPQVDSFVADLQGKNPDFRFTPRQPIDVHHNVARLYWQVGSKEKPDAVTGMDLFVIEDGKVKHLYVFVD